MPLVCVAVEAARGGHGGGELGPAGRQCVPGGSVATFNNAGEAGQ